MVFLLSLELEEVGAEINYKFQQPPAVKRAVKPVKNVLDQAALLVRRS